jgi:hypothetical protein
MPLQGKVDFRPPRLPFREGCLPRLERQGLAECPACQRGTWSRDWWWLVVRGGERHQSGHSSPAQARVEESKLNLIGRLARQFWPIKLICISCFLRVASCSLLPRYTRISAGPGFGQQSSTIADQWDYPVTNLISSGSFMVRLYELCRD